MSDGWLGVDTHVHLGDYDDPEATLRESLDAGVRVVAGTAWPSEYRRLAAQFANRGGLQLGIGLHPMHAGGPSQNDELDILRAEFASTRWVSEIGLDGFFAENDGPSMSAQRRVLEAILDLGVSDKILSVHSRDAEELSLDYVLAAAPAAAIFHWYDGDVRQATRVADAGYYFSVNSFMLRSDRHRELLRWLPRDAILTETDGPTTTMDDGSGCRPADVLAIADALALLRDEDADALRTQLIVNADRLESSVV